jgi:hypothetical protein
MIRDLLALFVACLLAVSATFYAIAIPAALYFALIGA